MMTDEDFRNFMKDSCPTFVKLFHYEDIGQVLVHKVNNTKDGKCGIRVVVNYKGNYFSEDTKMPNDEAGLDDRDELFDRIDERLAYGQGRSVMMTLLTMLYPKGLPKLEESKIII
jgi:hypothetical protein